MNFYWLIRAISYTSVTGKRRIYVVLQSDCPHCLQQTVHATASKENLFLYEEEWNGEDVTITVTSNAPFSVEDKEKLTIRRDGNYLIYEDALFVSEEQSAYSDNPMANAMYSGGCCMNCLV